MLDNTTTTTYTFTPDAGECATIASLQIIVNDPVTPTFDPIAPICSGEAISALPTTSLEGISGTWSPMLDNTATTTYTFTPDAGECATIASLQIIVNDPVTPTFNPIAPICSGEAISPLPTISLEGISGTWSPELDNTTTTIYTFTPDAGQCATIQVIEMIVNEPTLTSVYCDIGEPFSGNRTIIVNATASGNYEYQLDGGAPQYENIFYEVTPGIHTVTVSDINGCSASITTEVLIIDYPKFFTPNGDGINDTWNLIGLNQADAKVYIFDRYGKLLKQISSVGSGWDGTFNGEQLPSTDYWFTVDFLYSSTNKQFKAHFSLKR